MADVPLEVWQLFPAWAGVIPEEEMEEVERATFPRVGGGDPGGRLIMNTKLNFSPLGRG